MKKLRAKLVMAERGWSKEEKARKLAEEDLGKLTEERRVWLLEKKALEERVAILTAEVAPTKEEMEDTKDFKTQAELVAPFQLAMDDA